MSPRELPMILQDTIMSEMLYTRWLSSVLIFVDCQGCTPRFETRGKHLTGRHTTALKAIKRSSMFFWMIQIDPLSFESFSRCWVRRWKGSRGIGSLPFHQLRCEKNSTALGYKATTSTPSQFMIDVVTILGLRLCIKCC
jgi:hypothetical protein